MAVLMETTLRLVFDEFRKVVEAQTTQIPRFKTPLNRLQIALKTIGPVFSESRRLSKVLDRPQKETAMFISHLKKGKHLVLKSSANTSFHNACQKSLHTYMLIRLNNELVRFFQTELQVKTNKRSLIGIDLGHKMDQVLSGCFTTHLIINSSSITLPALDEFPIVEELTLNIDSDGYSLPECFKRMSQLKVLSITGCNDYPSKVDNLALLGCLTSLRKIRLGHVSFSSVEPIFALRNLKQLSFVMCETGDAFMSYTIESVPNLTDLEIDTSSDLKQLPSALCNCVHLQKLTINNCHELAALPKGLGGLSSLEMLSLRGCTKLQEIPESIGGLRDLSTIDISDCLILSALPEEIGELSALRVLKMSGCGGLQELPVSISKLGQLEEVICDEEMSYLWMEFESDLLDLKINVVEDDRLESFMKIVQ